MNEVADCPESEVEEDLSNVEKVSLVGAGPGEPELLTVKGLRLLETADVIVHDRLINNRLLAMARPDAEVVDVGKIPGGGRRQSDINNFLISTARQGKRVVRLKGGDPFVFGRGGEEADALVAAGVPFEVVPGVTSAVAAPAYAGIPLTHREHASSFTVVTGSLSGKGGGNSPDWETLAKTPGTLVILMGWRNLSDIAAKLIANGRSGATPSAVVSWGSEPWQMTATGRLDSIADIAKSQGLEAPATVVVGDVVRLRERLNWFESLPLLGRRVLVTRTRNQAGLLSRHLAELGAIPIEVPTIDHRPPHDYAELDNALAEVSGFDWIVFASANAVRAVYDRLVATGRDSRSLHSVRVAAIGPATPDAISECGIVADLVPETATSKGLTDALAREHIHGSRILLPRADIATQDIPERLIALGAVVKQVTAYRTVIPEGSKGQAAEALQSGIDVATFTSSSTVRNLLGLLENEADSLAGAKIACIGPTTASTAGSFGLKVDIVAKTPTIAGLVEALIEHIDMRK